MTRIDPYNDRDVAAVIVNYRTADLVLGNLAELAEQCAAGRRAEIFIVENCSPTHDAAILREALGHARFSCPVQLIESAVNGGFGAGNNIVLKRVLAAEQSPDFILFINPDARLRAGALDALLKVMDDNPRCGFAGPSIFDANGRPAASAFRRFSILSEFEQTARTAVFSALLWSIRVPMPPQATCVPVDWVSGAVFLARSAALREIGLFDEKFFLYFEEVDLMMRGRRLGWETWHMPAAEAEHLEGQSDPDHGQIDRVRHPSEHWYRSRTHYFRKTHGAFYAALADGARLAGSVFHLLGSRLKGRRDEVAWPEILKFIRLSRSR